MAPMIKNIKSYITNKDYKTLVAQISNILIKGKKLAYQTVNAILTTTYYEIGRQIVEFEQGGKKRAEYGESTIKQLSVDLTKQFGPGFSYRNLQQIKKFYTSFSKVQTVSAQSFPLSWSHYVRLMSIDNTDERRFYEIESIQNSWSVRELGRQFDSSLYERLALSKDKKGLKKLATKGQIIEKPQDLFKEPYVLEFLGLNENHNYSESDLENAIINNLEHFLLELGKGFTFVARQKRITSGTKHFYIDLVFYNRLLKCFVLIDLKIGELKHQDIGQMQMYVNYFDRELREKEENPTIGIVLCKERDDFIVQYTLPKDNKQIFAKQYKLYLPKKEELIEQMKKVEVVNHADVKKTLN
jgi:predicted nuclease of restriction endonuclease-like (RecB) superfamily